MNTPVNFEIAKLLKEKGYTQFKAPLPSLIFEERYRPTIAEAVMWLYEKHGIWISVWRYRDYAADCNDDYSFKHNYSGSTTFKTPTEAYSSAILYILNNLVCK